MFQNVIDGNSDHADLAGDVYAVFDNRNIKSAEPVTYDNAGNVIPLSKRFNLKNEDIRFSLKTTTKPETFYSLMGKAIDGIKAEKVGANGVVSYLKGRGVKNEEIKWSGIEAWLEGKKSVTKKELQEFVAGSMLQIEEQVREGKKDKNLKIRTVSRNSVELYDGEQLLDTLTKDKYGIWSSDTDPMRYGYRRGKYHAFCKSRYCRATDGYSFIMNENQCRVQ